MTGSQRGLGRGLDALFRNTIEPAKAADVTRVAVRNLRPNPNQPRKIFDEEALEELAASIRTQGVLQPLLVRPIAGTDPQAYEIVAGERRWRASQKAGLREVPVLVRDLSDQETMAVALIENLQREDLNPMEEALAMHDLREQFAMSQEDLATKLGKSRPAVTNTLRLLQLPEAARDDLKALRITPGHARAILSVTDAPVQEALREAIVVHSLTVRYAEEAANHWKKHGVLPEALHELPSRAQAPKAPSTGRAKPPALKLLQKRIAADFNIRASVSGSEDKGRITLTYDTPEQLAALKARLGLED